MEASVGCWVDAETLLLHDSGWVLVCSSALEHAHSLIDIVLGLPVDGLVDRLVQLPVLHLQECNRSLEVSDIILLLLHDLAKTVKLVEHAFQLFILDIDLPNTFLVGVLHIVQGSPQVLDFFVAC